MRTLFLRILSLLALALWVSSCTIIDEIGQQAATQPNHKPLPAHPLYVMALSAGKAHNNELVIVDPVTWQVVRRTPLLSVFPWDFSRDPQGRIWLGYGAEPGGDERVQIFAPDGQLLKTLVACDTPYNLIHFAAGHAFIPCNENGFHAAVVVVDLVSLEIVKKVDIHIDGDIFLLGASGGNETYAAIFGNCLLYTSPSPRDRQKSRMPSSA